jgi:hypothetical protein
MLCATADATASVRIEKSTYRNTPAHDASVIERYAGMFAKHGAALSDTKPEKALREVHPIAARWFNIVERRIRQSVLPVGQRAENDGRWLTQDIADTASAFFKATSDVLPAEPFIYSSRNGDLVAEFSAPHGTLTNIVSQTFVVAFAVVDGVPIEKRLELACHGRGRLRQELQQLTKMLHTGRHGAQVESQN